MENSNDNYPEKLKVVLLGDSAVGKTSLRYQYIGKAFKSDLMTTLGVDFSLKDVNYGNIPVKLQIWDVGGQPTYSQIRKTFYGSASAGIVMYDVENRTSYENVIHWVEEFLKHCGVQKTIVIVVGNKIDLRIEKVEHLLSPGDGVDLVESLEKNFNRVIPFYETSALTGEKINLIFEKICQYHFNDE